MILLTGASGFIGTHLLKSLADIFGSENIIVLTSKPIDGYRFVLHNNYTFNKNIWQENGAAQIDTVIHAGAFTPKNGKEANDWNACPTNIVNTKYLLDHLPSGVEKFIFLSTLDVYKETKEVIDENAITEPVTLYGHSKLFCEKMILSWAEQENKLAQILRVGHIYGPGEDAYQKFIPVTISNILNGKQPVIYSNGQEKRSFLFIDNCVQAIVKSVSLSEYPGPINIVSSKAFTIAEIVQAIITISTLNISPQILNKDIAVKDFVFNNQKMQQYLPVVETELLAGLLEEYNSMNKKFNISKLAIE